MSILAATLLFIVGSCGRALWGATNNHEFMLAVAVSSGLLANAAHALVDFVWYTPACVSVALVLAACALRLGQLSRATAIEESTWSKSRWLSAATTATLAGIWAITTAFGPGLASLHWDKYHLASINHEANKLARYKPTRQAAEKVTRDDTSLTECMIFHLQNILKTDPNAARAHIELADLYMQMFEARQLASENAMNILQVRDAAIASQFSSAHELQEWLKRACGENSQLLYRAYFHTYQGLRLCPLQASGYLYLANLCFLEGQRENTIKALVDQSVLLRPHDGQVLFEVGRQYLAQGRIDEAVKFWQEAYLSEGIARLSVLEILAGRTPAQAFFQYFSPDWHSLKDVWTLYRQRGTVEDLQQIVAYALAHAETPNSEQSTTGIAHNWLEVSKMQQELQDTGGALASLERACKLAPDDYPIRRSFGRTLLNAGQFSAAEVHLRWCAARNADDPRLKSELIQAATKRTLQTAQAASHLEHTQ